MKKLLTLLLALTLSLSLATAALADDGNSRVRQFDPTITVTKNGGTTWSLRRITMRSLLKDSPR